MRRGRGMEMGSNRKWGKRLRFGAWRPVSSNVGAGASKQ